MLQGPWFWLVGAVAVPVYWRLPPRLRASFLALVSAGVLATEAPWTVAGAVLWTVLFHVLLGRHAWRRVAVPVLVGGVLLQLAAFKYVPVVAAPGGVVPLGLSFFTCKLVHYGVERGRGRIEDHSLPAMLSWVLFFPMFTAGPIERFDHFEAHRQERLAADDVLQGLTRVLLGLIKKFVVADLLIMAALNSKEGGLTLPVLVHAPAWSSWLFGVLTLAYIYVDFSAYSDLAIGAGRLFGLRIAENFDLPLSADSIGDFWRRWHISLVDWCRSYVYMPALGITRSPWVGVLLTFLAVGLWHEGTALRALWGLYHALGMMAWLAWRREERRRKWTWTRARWWGLASRVLTLGFVSASHVFVPVVGSTTVEQSLRVLGRMVGLPV